MKVLLADKFPEKYKDELKSLGHEITSSPDLQPEDLPGVISGYNVLIVRSTKVKADTIKTADSLKMIIRAGAGTNTIDTDAAAEKGIYVCNCPGKNALAVAELAFGLLLSIDRNIPDNVIEMRNNNWDKKRFSKTQGIYGRNVGIVGLGQIGLAFAERAKAFGMNLYAIAKTRSPESQKRLDNLGFSCCKDLNELAETCDVLTFHVPSNADTKNLINKELLSHVKPNTILINTSRGNIVDDEALIEAMNAKNLRVGADVFNNEPASGKDSISTPLSQHPNLYGTHHIGASTEQAQDAVAAEVINVINDLENSKIRNCVNIDTKILV
jgi:D-3-phosphoglycerate dehydrogenase / 2-oxoglutarate reductase